MIDLKDKKDLWAFQILSLSQTSIRLIGKTILFR